MHASLERLLLSQGFSLSATFANIGWSTERTVSELGSQIRAATQQYAPRLAIIVLGGNDQPTSEEATHITELVQPLLAAGVTVVWVGPAHAVDPDIANRKAHIAAIQKPLLAQLGATWLDGLPMTRDLQHTPDGVHFVQSSSALWAERIVAAIIPQPSLLWSLTPFGALLGNALKRC
jgi:lysophospholipase L1-like esterase